MSLTPYHAKYFAYEPTKRCPPDSAQVDLNSHQVDAALFALYSSDLLKPSTGSCEPVEKGCRDHLQNFVEHIELQAPALSQQRQYTVRGFMEGVGHG